MRVVTWNIGGGFIYLNEKNKLENVNYFIKELEKIRPDIICFQEIHVSKKNNQPQIIAKKLGLKFIKTKFLAESHLKEGEKLCLSIISKYPIVSSKFHKLKNPNLKMILGGKEVSSHDKGFLEAEILYCDKKIIVLCGHMVPFHRFGRDFLEEDFKQIRNEIEKILSNIKVPVIIGADMNFEDVERLIPNIFKKGYKSVIEKEPTTLKNKRYDKIIISKVFISKKVGINKGKADHYLCFSDVEFKN